MAITGTKAFYFSATGGTKAVLEGFLQNMQAVKTVCLNRPIAKTIISADALAVFAAPVYEGRIAPGVAERFRAVVGNGGPAVVIVVYGNREYEDALIELYDIISENNFTVIAAAAFVAEHNAYARLGAGRPDSADLLVAADFAEAVRKKITIDAGKSVSVTGNRPYRDLRSFKVTPVCSDACNACGLCVTVCPQLAIEKTSPSQTDATLCMTCLACIKYCPQKARQIPPEYRQKYDVFLEKFTIRRKEPELYCT